jgi:MoaA/NifB/PqqE/SkfB family radical SAM enzyme
LWFGAAGESTVAGFDTIYYDIVGVCNAKCSYCHTGVFKTTTGSIVSTERFRDTLDVIARHGLLNPDGVMGLYNWGEPFLHPRLADLLQVVNGYGFGYGFSTNASKVPAINRDFVRGLKYLVYSMPGFSQGSYDKMHGFRFEEILKNIRTMTTKARDAGFTGKIAIYYHVYQFSAGEIFQCADFANECGIQFVPMNAILNNWWQVNAFVDNRLEPELLRKVGEELFMNDVRPLLAKAPANYSCPQYNWLAIDENSNLLLCCQVPTGATFSVGNLLTDDVAQMLAKRRANDTCGECVGKGLAYYLNNSLGEPEFYTEARKRIDEKRRPGEKGTASRVLDRARSFARKTWHGALESRPTGEGKGRATATSIPDSGDQQSSRARQLLGEPGIGVRLQQSLPAAPFMPSGKAE